MRQHRAQQVHFTLADRPDDGQGGRQPHRYAGKTAGDQQAADFQPFQWRPASVVTDGPSADDEWHWRSKLAMTCLSASASATTDNSGSWQTATTSAGCVNLGQGAVWWGG